MRKTARAETWLPLSFLIVALTAGLLAQASGSAPAAQAGLLLQGGTTVVIAPARSELACGQTGNVDIQINNVTNLYGVDVRVTFDPSILEVVDADPVAPGVQVQWGNLPDVLGSQGQIYSNDADNVFGIVNYAAIRLTPATPQSGSGVIASITFRGKNAGTSPMNIAFVLLADPMANPIQAVRSNGQMVVKCPTPAPVPVCPQIVGRVPQAVMAAALADPTRVQGYQQPLRPGWPVSPFNPLKTWLSLRTVARPYHPVFNGLEFKAGCP